MTSHTPPTKGTTRPTRYHSIPNNDARGNDEDEAFMRAVKTHATSGRVARLTRSSLLTIRCLASLLSGLCCKLVSDFVFHLLFAVCAIQFFALRMLAVDKERMSRRCVSHRFPVLE